MDVTSGHERARVFYGWWVVAAVFVILMFSSGLAFYAQAVFLDALVEEQGFSTGLTGAATGLFFVVAGVTGFLAGGPIGRHDMRWIIVPGSFLAAVGLVLLGRATEPWQMFAADVVFGMGFATSGLVPSTTLITRWFERRRSVALSIGSSGLSMGGIVITPIVAKLVDDRSFQDMAPWFALALVIGIAPVALLVVRSRPSDLGLEPDGAAPEPEPEPVGATGAGPDGAASAAEEPVVVRGTPYAEAIRSRFFVVMTAAYAMVMLAQVGALQHEFKLVKERVDVDTAALIVTLVAASSVVGRLGGGVLVLRVSARALTATLMAVQSVALVLFSQVGGRVGFLAVAVLFGLSVGNLLMLHPLLLADRFGIRDYSRIYGLSQLVMTTGVGLGPFVVGVLHDWSGYGLAFLVAASASAIAFMLFLPLARERSEDAPDVRTPAVTR
ncbi:MAG: MFS transporter [Actinomycetota bacterium]|nr:MFS transporter [Actinomycetota bacterium]